MLNSKVCEKEDFFSLSKETDLKIGDKISGEYSVDFDIWKIHLIIRDLFSHYYTNKKSMSSELESLNAEIERTEKSFLKVQELKRTKYRLESLLKKFSEDNWLKYIESQRESLLRYKELSTYSKKKVFHIGGKKKESTKSDKSKQESDLIERLEIIRKYLKYASQFLEIDVTFHPPYQIGCDSCGMNLDEMSIDEDQGVYICECSNTFGRVYSNETPHADPDKIETVFRNSYDDKTNFWRRLKSYQGFHSRKIPDDLIDFLDEHMQKKYKLPPAEKIRKMEPDEYGHRGSDITSVPLLIEALKETNNSAHFQDINPICYELWGWICPNIDGLIPQIMEDYTRTQLIYKTKHPNLSSINVELRLYWHLRIVGHNCLLEDFKIPQSMDSKKRNSHIFQIMCEETGLPFYPII